jgi:hypothetical protein
LFGEGSTLAEASQWTQLHMGIVLFACTGLIVTLPSSFVSYRHVNLHIHSDLLRLTPEIHPKLS